VGFSVSLFIPSLGVQGCVTSLAQIPPLSLRHKLNAIKKNKKKFLPMLSRSPLCLSTWLTPGPDIGCREII
jgi:hypothetical protein